MIVGKVNMNWSTKQTDIFDFCIDPTKGSVVVIAVAGAGKTTTMVEAVRRILAHYANVLARAVSVCAVAFNRDIKDTLEAKMPKPAEVYTLNAMGNRSWLKTLYAMGFKGKADIKASKTYFLMKDMLSDFQLKTYGGGIPKLVGLAKSMGIVPKKVSHNFSGLTPDTDASWIELIEHHNIEFEEDGTIEQFIELAREVLIESIGEARKGKMDFDDQLYMPIIAGSRFVAYDFLLVDEAQDVNLIQRAMLKRALKPGGRLIAVGDPHQAIYGFRGADTSSIANIKRDFNAIELPLTVSYRCPRAVVAEARNFVKHIEAHPDAPMGSVTEHECFTAQMFRPTDSIICRNTAPTVDLAFKLIRSGVACRVLGKQIGEGLVNLIKKMKGKTIEDLLARLSEYSQREVAKFMAKSQEDKAEALMDRMSTIYVFIDNLNENRRTIPALIERVEAMFDDSKKTILTLSTIHKAKGQEWDRVFILNRELMPSKYARQAWQLEQETNLQYVAVTRAKSELHYIELKTFVEKRGVQAVGVREEVEVGACA
jgi:DNA helicase-2/ATP-dependent DNA helicase PcrA